MNVKEYLLDRQEKLRDIGYYSIDNKYVLKAKTQLDCKIVDVLFDYVKENYGIEGFNDIEQDCDELIDAVVIHSGAGAEHQGEWCATFTSRDVITVRRKSNATYIVSIFDNYVKRFGVKLSDDDRYKLEDLVYQEGVNARL